MAPRALKEKPAAPIIAIMKEFIVRPDPDDPRLTRRVQGIDQEGKPIETAVVTERPLTLFLNGREIVTMMTIGDHPDYLAVGLHRVGRRSRAPGRPHSDRPGQGETVRRACRERAHRLRRRYQVRR